MSILNLLMFSLLSSGFAGHPCPSPQYLQLGTTGLINCTFKGDFTVIAWFNSTLTHDDHIATIRESGQSVDGSGEFDIAKNGSLLIMNVSLQHEHTFCVVTVGTEGIPPSYCTDVVTVVFPVRRKPLITDVRNCSEGVCFGQYFKDSIIRCSVENTRPAVNLTWAVRSGSADRTISHQSSTVPSPSVRGASSSFVILIDPFLYSKTLALVVCKGNSQPNMLKQNESLIFLQNRKSDLSSVTPDPLYAAIESTIVLNCPKMEKNLLVWNRKGGNSQHMNMVAYAVFSESLFVSSGEKLTLNSNGSLVISEVSVKSRGIYICLAGDGEHEEAQSYDVHVYAPAFPEVEDCGLRGYCVLLAEEYDKLTCVIRGVPEGVRLGFTPLSPQEASITFLEQVVEIRDAGDFFDVSVTATYHASGSGESAFQCCVIEEHKELFSHTAVFSLHVEPAINTTPETNYEFDFGRAAFAILVAVLALGSLTWIRLCWLRSVRRGDTPSKEAQSSEADVERQPCMLMSGISIQQSEGLRANSFNC